MNNDVNIESKFIKQYVILSKQKRYINFIIDSKKRRKFVLKLSHFADLKFENFDLVEKNEIQVIKDKLKACKNLTDCYIISENEKIDGKRLETDIALAETIGRDFGTILIFGDVKIIYYEGEGKMNRWISK